MDGRCLSNGKTAISQTHLLIENYMIMNMTTTMARACEPMCMRNSQCEHNLIMREMCLCIPKIIRSIWLTCTCASSLIHAAHKTNGICEQYKNQTMCTSAFNTHWMLFRILPHHMSALATIMLQVFCGFLLPLCTDEILLEFAVTSFRREELSSFTHKMIELSGGDPYYSMCQSCARQITDNGAEFS